MKTEVIDKDAKKIGEIELLDRVFSQEVNNSSIYESLTNQLANRRQGTHQTKTRATVHGTTSKPWRQKGTGRARAGTTKSPLWTGGGVIFGPHPRDYSYSIPKKVRQKALFSVLSHHAASGRMKILEDFEMKEFKTKEVAAIFSKATGAKKVIYIANSENKENYQKIKKSANNIPWLRIVNANALEIKDLFYAEEVILSKSAAEELNKRYEK